ncbi:sensor histidine kinase [Symbioplanes lichenis]|uniref:sensor histidine kinase n=1 Tax=Symbioplanes lichenis TaxID=1629072 RepID=UPI002738BAFF|nr:HAMP domain-containing sensor histidine kinase [Actinoplanes lichenis]
MTAVVAAVIASLWAVAGFASFTLRAEWSDTLSAAAASASPAVAQVLMLLAPLMVVTVAAIAWYATRRALRPVKRVRIRAAQLMVADPSGRVEVPETGGEIAALAEVVNGTLARAQRAGDAQRRLVADAAHELRSPLAVLQAGLDVALAYPDRTDWRRTVVTAAEQVGRLTALTDDLLLMAQLDAGRGTPVPPSPVDVPATLIRLAGEAEVVGRDVRVSVLDPVPLLVLIDRTAFERIVRNLLDNAVRHAAAVVEVRAATGTRRLRVSVADDGPGIPGADQDRIFERFTRLGDARDRHRGGTGLGLAIARELAHRLGGTLVVAGSEASGATFTLDLPADALDESPGT